MSESIDFRALCAEKIKRALMSVSGGLCSFSAGAKHQYLLDVKKILDDIEVARLAAPQQGAPSDEMLLVAADAFFLYERESRYIATVDELIRFSRELLTRYGAQVAPVPEAKVELTDEALGAMANKLVKIHTDDYGCVYDVLPFARAVIAADRAARGPQPAPAPDSIQQRAVADVLDERARQDARWGVQNHETFVYLAILVEEVGELAQAELHRVFGGPEGTKEHVREEAVQTAAVALAIIECLDRGLQPGNQGET